MKLFNAKSKEDHFKDIIGYEDLKGDLERIIDVINNKEKYSKLGGKVPKNLLIDGEPGTGKTTIAKDFLSAVNRKKYILRKNKPNGEFVSEIERVFEEAKKNQPSVILLDDMDKFANGDRDHVNCEEYVTIQSCIDDVKNDEVFVFATTNNTHALPRSLMREGRFDKKINILYPNKDDREKIIEHYLKGKNIDKNIKLEVVARILADQFSAGIETVLNNAAVEAGFRGSDVICLEDIVIAALKLRYNIRFESSKDKRKLEKVACHEAGHTLVSTILFPKNNIFTSILPGEGAAGGLSSHIVPANISYDKYTRMYEMMITLGGKAATEIVYGDVDLGANGDMHKLFHKAEFLVDDVCAFGFDKFEREHSSNELINRREQEVYAEINRAYTYAKKVIAENREFFDKLVAELIDKKVLLYNEIDEIKAKCKIVEFKP